MSARLAAPGLCESDRMVCRSTSIPIGPTRHFPARTLMTGLFLAISTFFASAGISPVHASAAAPSASSTLRADATPSTRVSVCRIDERVASLSVRRDAPSNPTTFSFPGVVSVVRASDARSVARALCALPLMPKGVFHCPSDIGPTYSLRFRAPTYSVTLVTLDPTGCEVVHGLPGIRWVATSPRFWRILGDAMHLHLAAQATFAGHVTNG